MSNEKSGQEMVAEFLRKCREDIETARKEGNTQAVVALSASAARMAQVVGVRGGELRPERDPRREIAAQAMVAILAGRDYRLLKPDEVAAYAVDFAEALLKELED
jgi:hypothetical protein